MPCRACKEGIQHCGRCGLRFDFEIPYYVPGWLCSYCRVRLTQLGIAWGPILLGAIEAWRDKQRLEAIRQVVVTTKVKI